MGAPRLAAALVLLLVLTGLARAEPDIAVHVSPQPAEVGLLMAVEVVVSGAEGSDCTLIETPVVVGASLDRIQGPSLRSSFQIINGRQSQWVTATWTFRFVPRVAGELEIPPFRFNLRGEELRSEATRVEVGEATGLLSEHLVSLDVRPSDDELWVGEAVMVTVEAGVREDAFDMLSPQDGRVLDLPWLDGGSGLYLEDVPVPDCNRGPMPVNGGPMALPTCLRAETRDDGHSWIVHTWQVPLRATVPGVAQLEGSRFEARAVTETRIQRDPFSLFGRGRTEVPTRIVALEARGDVPIINVRNTPVAGRPEGYTNAVGRFELRAEAQPRALKVGESCRIVLELSLRDPDDPTSGNLEMVEWPEFEALFDDFRMFGKEEREFAGLRELVLEVSPKNDRVSEVPPLELHVFDPEEQRYEVLEVGPFPLTVEAGGEDGLTTALATEQELLNDLETIRERLPGSTGAPTPGWIWPALGLLVLGVVEVRRWVSGWRAANPQAVARRGARRTLERELAEADAGPRVAAAFARYLAARLGGPAGGLTAEEAAERLDDAALAEEIRRVVEGWEAAYLGGAGLDVERAREEARALAQRLEAEA